MKKEQKGQNMLEQEPNTDLSTWIKNGLGYVVVMKSGSQHCFVTNSVKNGWIYANAGISKTLCLYDSSDESDCLKLIVDDFDVVRSTIGLRPIIIMKTCLSIGSEMMIREDDISIIERNNSTVLGEGCLNFDETTNFIEAIIKSVPELKKYWTSEIGFKKRNNLKIEE